MNHGHVNRIRTNKLSQCSQSEIIANNTFQHWFFKRIVTTNKHVTVITIKLIR